ncbi:MULTISPECIES: TetR/AcrR family transcriptional regulator C-terminal domain-containing protein [Paeniglutamicibacter]|uniref:AcrR family transcriptional regulator n=1 Tax=Paeniglutamicibacter sulfureus TaxID=43666 RepID=A0ABU2BJ42_9MICC|nr:MULTISPECIES: TetR/AcrR family transcriptional regulator C-terminal domain-containing protein [Paeniglutamicibacter]MCV9993135.1 TetR/AcrR family transcriptional regulator C-terminal domain-containing protein [Paeniglutamicibacter sp. ZC-3]MDR7357733.1 AcrR family transcriptional regulator [Paeniglutamicibacter sulfureus]
MDSSEVRRAGRPRTSVLDRERILVAALRLLNSVGPEKFSMAALAGELGVKPPALYHHVKNKQALLVGMREVVNESIDVSGFGSLSWREAVERWARSYRAAFSAHPNAIALLATEPITGATRTLAMYECVVQGFLAAGWEASAVMGDMVALESFILGSALDVVAPDDMFDPGDAAAQTPGLAGVLAAQSALEGSRANHSFEVGLAIMIDGLARRNGVGM